VVFLRNLKMVTGALSNSRLQDPGAAGSSKLFEIVKTLPGIYWLCCHLLSPRRGETQRERVPSFMEQLHGDERENERVPSFMEQFYGYLVFHLLSQECSVLEHLRQRSVCDTALEILVEAHQSKNPVNPLEDYRDRVKKCTAFIQSP
jgi:hypothetical protein